MTRLQAVLLMTVILAALSLRQNIRWPMGLWDAPAFRTFRFEELPDVAKLLAHETDATETPTSPPPGTVLTTEEKPASDEEGKPEEKPRAEKKQKPKPKNGGAKARPATKAASPEPAPPAPDPIARVTLPEDMVASIRRCHAYETRSEPKSGRITVQFTEDETGNVTFKGVSEDTLQIPSVRACAEGLLKKQSLHDNNPPGIKRTVEAHITFGTK